VEKSPADHTSDRASHLVGKLARLGSDLYGVDSVVSDRKMSPPQDITEEAPSEAAHSRRRFRAE